MDKLEQALSNRKANVVIYQCSTMRPARVPIHYSPFQISDGLFIGTSITHTPVNTVAPNTVTTSPETASTRT